jgi:D-alanyl-D-alanine carboxypeptidase
MSIVDDNALSSQFHGTFVAVTPALQSALEHFLAETGNVPGAMVRIRRGDGTVHSAAAGVADRRTGAPMSKQAIFRLASNTKTFTAAAILRTYEQGLLDVDAPVASLVPKPARRLLAAFCGRSPAGRITARQLLQHTSGLPQLDEEALLAVVRERPHKRWTPLERLEFGLRCGPPAGAPGERVTYSDAGYIVLACVLERLSGLPLAATLRQQLRLDQLGLEATYLESLEAPRDAGRPRLRQYAGDLDLSDFDPSFDLYGGGGLISDLADVERFWTALFHGAVFDSERTLATMLTTIPDAGGESRMGMGLSLRRYGEIEAWCKGGFWGTFAAYQADAGLTLAGCVNQATHFVDNDAFSRLQSTLLEIGVSPS